MAFLILFLLLLMVASGLSFGLHYLVLINGQLEKLNAGNEKLNAATEKLIDSISNLKSSIEILQHNQQVLSQTAVTTVGTSALFVVGVVGVGVAVVVVVILFTCGPGGGSAGAIEQALGNSITQASNGTLKVIETSTNKQLESLSSGFTRLDSDLEKALVGIDTLLGDRSGPPEQIANSVLQSDVDYIALGANALNVFF